MTYIPYQSSAALFTSTVNNCIYTDSLACGVLQRWQHLSVVTHHCMRRGGYDYYDTMMLDSTLQSARGTHQSNLWISPSHRSPSVTHKHKLNLTPKSNHSSSPKNTFSNQMVLGCMNHSVYIYIRICLLSWSKKEINLSTKKF